MSDYNLDLRSTGLHWLTVNTGGFVVPSNHNLFGSRVEDLILSVYFIDTHLGLEGRPPVVQVKYGRTTVFRETVMLDQLWSKLWDVL